MRLKNLILTSIFITIILNSCKKDEDCNCIQKNRYIKSVTINSIPSSNWDIGSNPDLKINFGRASSLNWEYFTNVVEDNSSYPVTLFFPYEILASDENWMLQLVDEDVDTDDIIYDGTFNPVDKGEGGKIALTQSDNTQIMTVNYVEE